MTQSRREFVRTAAAGAAAAGLLDPLAAGAEPVSPYRIPEGRAGDPNVRELLEYGIDAAKTAGAEYADMRVGLRREQSIFAREHKVQALADAETFGFGIRVLVGGAWGFAASSKLERDEVAAIAKRAAAQARANRVAQGKPVVLAPVTPTPNGEWKTPIRVDPFSVGVPEKADLLLRANAAALGVKGAQYVSSGLLVLREDKSVATSDGTFVFQTKYQCQPFMTVTAVGNGDFQSRSSNEIAPMGLGYEHVLDATLVERAPTWAEEAVEKLSAKPVEAGRYDLVLHPSHLWLTIHESIGHPTELDRALGFEANFAGTSFVAPPAKVLGKLKYGPEFMNIQGDRSQPGSLAAIGWDDEGVKPEDFLIVKNGIFNDYQTTREQALWLDWWYKREGREARSHGCSYAQSWADVQFQRMPNVSLLPGEKDLVWEDLIAATDKGIAIIGDGSFSIDQQRYNAQFGGQLFYEIRGGKIVGMLKDVAYQMRTPDFWGSMDMIGGKRSYFVGGAFSDGKGQPMQLNAVSHGCVPTRHRQASVLNTGSKA